MAAAGWRNPGDPAGPTDGIALSERVSATGLFKIGVVRVCRRWGRRVPVV